jgi:Mg-chelatase subunit ChlD/type II secretory pathway pseudopilin PulG
MNPNQPSREEIEAKLTALLLGELPAEEGRLLRYAIAHDAGLQKLQEELAQTIVLVREAAKTPVAPEMEKTPMIKLSDERRAKLLAHFQTPRPQPKDPLFWLKRIDLSRIQAPRLLTVLAVLAIVAVLAAMMLPALSKAKSKSMRVTQLAAAKQRALEQQMREEDEKAAIAPPVATTAPAMPQEVVTVATVPVVAPPPVTIVLPSTTDAGDVKLALNDQRQNLDAVQKNLPRADSTTRGTDKAAASAEPARQSPGYLFGMATSVNTGDTLIEKPADLEAKVQDHFYRNRLAGESGGGGANGNAQRLPGVSTSSAVNVDEEHTLIEAERNRESNLAKNDLPTQSGFGRVRGGSGGGGVGGGLTQSQPNPGDYELRLVPSHALDGGSAWVRKSDGQPASPDVAKTLNRQFEQGAKAAPVPQRIDNVLFTENGINGDGNSVVTKEGYAVNSVKLNSGLGVTTGDLEAPKNLGEEYRREVASSGGVVNNQAGPSAITLPAEKSPAVAFDSAGQTTDAFELSKAKNSESLAASGQRQSQLRATGAFTANMDVDSDKSTLGLNGRDSFAVNGTVDQPPARDGQNLNGPAAENKSYTSVNGQSVNGVNFLISDDNAPALASNAKSDFSGKTEEQIKDQLSHMQSRQMLVEDRKLAPAKPVPSVGGEMLFVADDVSARQAGDTPATGSAFASSSVAQRVALPAPVVTAAPVSSPAANAFAKDDVGGLRYVDVTNALNDSETGKMDMNQALERYAKITGRTLLKSGLPSSKSILLPKTGSEEEEIVVLQKQLAENGVALINIGKKFVKVVPNPQSITAGAALENKGEYIAGIDQADKPLPKVVPNAPIPQPEVLCRENNFSTFSLNVSDVSFKLAAASLERGQLPDAASIRTEEFINAFDYRDPEATAGQPLAFASERARSPFAQNRDLLRFSVKTAAAGRAAGRPLNLVLLLDNSGSMERADRVAIIREELRVLTAQLQPQDTVSVVTFARTARLWADGLHGDQAGETLARVGGITPEGGTNLEEAMRLAYETARRHYLANGMNRVVLLTDGAANLGDVSPADLKQKVEAQRRQGIALDCFGIGFEDYNDDLLEQLSSNGDGRYAFLNSPEDAAKEFAAKLAGALQVAAQDVKVQVEFNPQRVVSWRQIGYAKHQLTKEQFRDNTVDAAEIAAQEAGNALYTVETKADGIGPIATVHVRYKVPGTTDYRERSWDVAYAGNPPALEQASPAMRLAATASAFSEWLAASPFAQEVTPDELLKTLSGVPQVYGADMRPKQLETMLREAKSISGK